MRKILFSLVVASFFVGGVSVLAETVPTSGVEIAPDSPFYIFKTLKESIQTFFTFGEENKARQYLHLADVRLAEYQKMLEKGKTDIAQKTLDKYEKQLNRAISKAEKLKSKGKDVKDISEEISNSAAKHIQVLEGNLQKVPEAAKKGLGKALENAKRIKGDSETVGLVPSEIEGWKTYTNNQYGFEIKYPENYFKGVNTKSENINELFYGKTTSLLASENFDAIKKQYLTNLSVSYIPLDFNAFKSKTIEYDEHFGRTPTEFMPIIIDQKNAYRFQSGSLNFGTQCLTDEVLIPIKTGGINITIGECLENDNDFSENEKMIFDQILSTFRFLPTRQ